MGKGTESLSWHPGRLVSYSPQSEFIRMDLTLNQLNWKAPWPAASGGSYIDLNGPRWLYLRTFSPAGNKPVPQGAFHRRHQVFRSAQLSFYIPNGGEQSPTRSVAILSHWGTKVRQGELRTMLKKTLIDWKRHAMGPLPELFLSNKACVVSDKWSMLWQIL